MVEVLGESHMQFNGNMTVQQEEFNKRFKAQQQFLLEEIRLLRIEHGEIHRKMNEWPWLMSPERLECTGKGNDQVRFELIFFALHPELSVVAPWKEWDIQGREDAVEYA
ncbi:hypothetical protein AgCh_019343 [Apium graveolens]